MLHAVVPPPRHLIPVAQPPPDVEDLTRAELRVLTLLPTHLSLQQIADELIVSRNTIKCQAAAIYRKLAASGRNEAVQSARGWGLLPEPTERRAAPLAVRVPTFPVLHVVPGLPLHTDGSQDAEQGQEQVSRREVIRRTQLAMERAQTLVQASPVMIDQARRTAAQSRRLVALSRAQRQQRAARIGPATSADETTVASRAGAE